MHGDRRPRARPGSAKPSTKCNNEPHIRNLSNRLTGPGQSCWLFTRGSQGKEGCYRPMKSTCRCQRWKKTKWRQAKRSGTGGLAAGRAGKGTNSAGSSVLVFPGGGQTPRFLDVYRLLVCGDAGTAQPAWLGGGVCPSYRHGSAGSKAPACCRCVSQGAAPPPVSAASGDVRMWEAISRDLRH